MLTQKEDRRLKYLYTKVCPPTVWSDGEKQFNVMKDNANNDWMRKSKHYTHHVEFVDFIEKHKMVYKDFISEWRKTWAKHRAESKEYTKSFDPS